MRSLTLPAIALLAAAAFADSSQVGPAPAGGHLVTTRQLIRPAGQSLEVKGRPVDLALSPDGKWLYSKSNNQIITIDAQAWKVTQTLGLPSGKSGSYHGIAVSSDGSRVYLTLNPDIVQEYVPQPGGILKEGRSLTIGADAKPSPCGIALSPGGRYAVVCASRSNSLAVVNLATGKAERQIPVGVAPYDVEVSSDGIHAWVSNWGGRRAREGDRTEMSSGTPAVVDERSVASSGTISLVDLRLGQQIAQIDVGLHPSDLLLDEPSGKLYVANANSDTVSVIDTASRRVASTIEVKPDADLPFGSAPNALSLDAASGKLLVALGGNNAIAVVGTKLEGLIPTAWYPGALTVRGGSIYVANVKGLGSRDASATQRLGAPYAPAGARIEGQTAGKPNPGWIGSMALGTLQKVPIPDASALRRYTGQARRDSRVPEALQALEKAASGVPEKPVPARLGEPSPFDHIVYIIKENKTYDQVFGDIKEGNGDPALCVFGEETTPNHHKLAREFVLLDNYYCNGVLSADGHQWVAEGYVTDYLEKAFGGFPRSYPYEGNDPLAYSSAGFIWDNVLLHGLSFRNYGEMSTAVPEKGASFHDIYRDSLARTGKFRFTGTFDIEPLRRYSCKDYPGWTLSVPDQYRADVFLRELAEFEKQGSMPNLCTVLLPNDHTAGMSPGRPTARAYVADNDLALGRIVEGISGSKFWKSTCIFVIEDDPQSGYDHVDGHRSICLVISPYTKRKAVISEFYNQTSVLHTMERMLGIPPMNQMDAMSPLMTACFTDIPNFAPYSAEACRIPWNEVTKAESELDPASREMVVASLAQPFDKLDMADEDTLNRIIWHSVKGASSPYPAAWAGPHGRGLPALGLALTDGEEDDD